MSGFKFKPASTYEALHKQARGMKALIDSLYLQIRQYEILRRETSPERVAMLEQQLESEKSMNAFLTDELEHKEREITRLKAQLGTR